MGHRPRVDSKTEDVRNQMEIDLGDGGIDLEVNPPFFNISIPRRDPSKEPVHLPKGIVGLRIRAIETDADPLNPGGLHLLDRLFGDQGAVGGHHHPQPFVRSMAGQIEDVGSEERFSSRQNDDRLAERRRSRPSP